MGHTGTGPIGSSNSSEWLSGDGEVLHKGLNNLSDEVDALTKRIVVLERLLKILIEQKEHDRE